jgi:hypothetical protein
MTKPRHSRRNGHTNTISSTTFTAPVFFSWLLIAYVVLARWFRIQRRDGLDPDFLATLAYPVVVAGHLIIQRAHFPGNTGEIWSITEEIAPFALSIQAAVQICVLSLCLNFFFILFASMFATCQDHPAGEVKEEIQTLRKTERLRVLAPVTLWILAALIYSSLMDSFGDTASQFFMGLLWIIVGLTTVLFLPVAIGIPAVLIVSPILYIIVTIRRGGATIQIRLLRLAGSFCFVLLCMFLMLCLSLMFILVYTFLCGFMPRSKYTIKDLGQSTALLGRIAHLAYGLSYVSRYLRGKS